MDHGPAVKMGKDNASDYKTHVGIIMFIVYGLIYLAFVLVNTFAPKIMQTKIMLGVNLAVIYGFALILLAIILGLVYNFMCTKKENELNGPDEKGGDKA